MTTEQIIEAEQTPEELAFAAISTRVTVAKLAFDEANEAFNRYKFDHPIPTSVVVQELARMWGEVERTGHAVQVLLRPYSEAKSKVEGW